MCDRCSNIHIGEREEGTNMNEGFRSEERFRLNEIINRGENVRNVELKNKGHTNRPKSRDCMRVLSMNPRGIGPDSVEKIRMLKKEIVRREIDLVLFSSPDRRWTASRVNRMKYLFRSISKNVTIIATDSGETITSDSGYLPGGTISIALGRIANVVEEETAQRDERGRWSSFEVQSGNESLQIMNMCRITDSSSPGVLKSRAQCDRHKGTVGTAKEYREELLQDVAAEIKRVREKGAQAIIIAGDFNQDVMNENIRKFLRENGLCDIHSELNESIDGLRDNAQEKGSKQIDAAFASEAALQVVTGSMLVDFNEIVMSDHRGFMFDVDLKELMDLEASKYDSRDRRTLNPTNRAHRTKFKESLEKLRTETKLEEKIARINHSRVSARELNAVDDEITHVLNKARKSAEGVRSNVPYSKEKEEIITGMKYVKDLIKIKSGVPVNHNQTRKRKETLNVDWEDKNVEELKVKRAELKSKWEEHKEKDKRRKEDKLLELFPHDLAADDENAIKRRKKAVKMLKQSMHRQNTFTMLSAGVGKGIKKSLSRIRIEDEQGNTIREVQDRTSMENEIMHHNKKHFRQAHDSKAYKDRIYNKLDDNRVRDAMLKGEIEEDECDHKEVHQFLKLLAKPVESIQPNNGEISVLEWERVVKKSKRKSASSVFSGRTCSVHKCALESEVMTELLVQFYNILLRNGMCLKRWIKLLDIILEKGKGPTLGKLRTIQLYEADLQLLMRIFVGGRNDNNIEQDERLSQFNYGSRRYYSIDTATLEKN